MCSASWAEGRHRGTPHSRTVPSADAEASVCPSGEKATPSVLPLLQRASKQNKQRYGSRKMRRELFHLGWRANQQAGGAANARKRLVFPDG